MVPVAGNGKAGEATYSEGRANEFCWKLSELEVPVQCVMEI